MSISTGSLLIQEHKIPFFLMPKGFSVDEVAAAVVSDMMMDVRYLKKNPLESGELSKWDVKFCRSIHGKWKCGVRKKTSVTYNYIVRREAEAIPEPEITAGQWEISVPGALSVSI